MIILTNCLTDLADEGCLKVANSLVKRIREKEPQTKVVTYGDSPKQGDVHVKTNKLMLNRKLLSLLRKEKEPVLYIPAVAKAHTMAARVFLLSLFAPKGIQVIQVMSYPMGKLVKLLLKLSKARIFAFSKDSWQSFYDLIGEKAEYLKTGVDTQRFCPIPKEQKSALREKYGLPTDKPIVLHVGHLKAKRNVEKLLVANQNAHAVLVTSSYAEELKDQQLKEKLLASENFTLIDHYLPDIQEIYQLSDVYLFPVVAFHNCIDVPLSAMEAAACGIPIVTTPFGEMKELLGKPGFYEIDSFEPEKLSKLVETAASEGKDPRQSVLEYDWNLAVSKVLL